MVAQKQPQDAKPLQWHPAFFAGIQIEFKAEAKYLTFENEHQLGTKPKQIDVLIIKKESQRPIQKNIGKIFRKYNLIEYKSPEDYLGIDDFYRVYGYACFFKADTATENEIKIDELTISFFCQSFPRKLVRHLKKSKGFTVTQRETGIFRITGDKIPMQIIVTGHLPEQENLWLRNLTNHLDGLETARKLVESYKANKNNRLYASMMDIIIHANQQLFQEEKTDMLCEAMRELWKDEIEADKKAMRESLEKSMRESIEQSMRESIEQSMRESIEQSMRESIEQSMRESIEQSMRESMQEELETMAEKAINNAKREGETKGQHQVNNLIIRLNNSGRTDEIIKAVTDTDYQKKLFEEFGI